MQDGGDSALPFQHEAEMDTYIACKHAITQHQHAINTNPIIPIHPPPNQILNPSRLPLPPNNEENDTNTTGTPLLQFSLKTVVLTTTPTYDCLSYTWGPPFASNDPRNAAYTGNANSLPLAVNGHIFHIGRNLYEFSLQMQQAIVNVNKRSVADGKTRLMHAAEQGDHAQAAFLLRKGADCGARDWYGVTALHRAAGQGHADVVLLLLSYGADSTLQNALGRTPRDWAIGREGKLRVLDFEPPARGICADGVLSRSPGCRAGFDGPRCCGRPMWIDAISINQEDTQERNSQVAIMSDIYSRGMRCGWLLGRALVCDEGGPEG